MAKQSNLTSRELLAQADALRDQAQALLNKEKPGALAEIRQVIELYGFTAAELGLETSAPTQRRSAGVSKVAAPGKSAGKKAAAKKKGAGIVKYRDDQGNSWTGFGPRPRWFKEAIASGVGEESLKA